jgi:hypothetical protein
MKFPKIIIANGSFLGSNFDNFLSKQSIFEMKLSKIIIEKGSLLGSNFDQFSSQQSNMSLSRNF